MGVEAGRPPLRIGHAERDAAVEALTRAHAQGRLDAAEAGDRIEAALRARVAADLDVLVADLPGGRPPDRVAVPDPTVAVLRGRRHDGPWVPAPGQGVVAVCATVQLDLRAARLPLTVQAIDVRVVCGRVEVWLPPGFALQTALRQVAGGRIRVTGSPADHPSAPSVRLTGRVVAGTVLVRAPRPRRRLRRR